MALRSSPGSEEVIEVNLVSVPRMKRGTMMDAIQGDTRLKTVTVFERDGSGIATVGDDTIDWNDIGLGRYQHREKLRSSSHKELISEKIDTWSFPDGYVARGAGETLMLFRHQDEPAVVLKVAHGIDRYRVDDQSYPKRCVLEYIQRVQGFDDVPYRKAQHLTVQEVALQAVIRAGVQLWERGWELQYEGLSAANAAMARAKGKELPDWLRYLRDRYFREEKFFAGETRWLLNLGKKKVQALLRSDA